MSSDNNPTIQVISCVWSCIFSVRMRVVCPLSLIVTFFLRHFFTASLVDSSASFLILPAPPSFSFLDREEGKYLQHLLIYYREIEE